MRALLWVMIWYMAVVVGVFRALYVMPEECEHRFVARLMHISYVWTQCYRGEIEGYQRIH